MSQLCLWQSPPQRPASYSFSGIRLLSPAEKRHSRVQILAIEPCYVVRKQCNTSQFRLSRPSFRQLPLHFLLPLCCHALFYAPFPASNYVPREGRSLQ
jgi:hypothetical protein